MALRPGAHGDISLKADQQSNEFVAWCQKQGGPYNPTTLVYRDLLYVLLDRGFLSCYDARTGEEVYSKKRLPNGKAFTSSPWASDGKIYCLNEDGLTFVIQAGREYKLLCKNALAEDDMCMATPAIVGNRLLVRTAARLYCVRKAQGDR
jgi:outer membrane protein assembly factor BamB